MDAANSLEQETKLGLRGYEVCDNVDLETILMEYESYYFVKFQKCPRPAAKSRKIPALLDQFACSTRCPLQIVQSQCVHLQDAVCYLKEPDPKMPSSLYLVEIHSHSSAISYLSASSYFLLTSRNSFPPIQ